MSGVSSNNSSSSHATAAVMSAAAPSLAVGLVLAEFDVDKGPCVRACYPRASWAAATATMTGAAAAAARSEAARRGGGGNGVDGISSPTSPASAAASSAAALAAAMAAGGGEVLASDMLPDGAERQQVAHTVLIVNRPQPPLFARLPAYLFVPADDKKQGSDDDDDAGDGDGNKNNTSTSAHSDAAAAAPPRHWRRHVTDKDMHADSSRTATLRAGAHGEELVGALSSHVVLVNKTTGALTVRGAEAGVLLDAVHVTLDELDVLPTLPHVAQQLAQQLSRRALVSYVTDDSSSTSSGHAAAAAAVRTASTSSSVAQLPAGFVFVVLRTRAVCAGLLMQVLHYQTLLQLLTDIQQPPPAVTTTSTTTTTTTMTTTAVTTSSDDKATRPACTSDDNGGGATDKASTSPTSVTSAATASKDKSSTTTTLRRLQQPQQQTPTPPPRTSGPVLYGLCAVVSKRNTAARRGGVTKSVAVMGPSLAWLEPFFATLVDAAQYCCDIPGSDDDAVQQQTRVLKLCYESINRAGLLIANTANNNNNNNSSDKSVYAAPLTRLRMDVYRYSTHNTPPRAYVTYRDAPFGTTRRVTLAVVPSLHDVTWTRCSLEYLVEALGPSFMLLVTGVLTEQRIVVLSRQGCATDVCEAALALGLLASTVDRDALAHRLFPCVALHHADAFVRVPGYIVGAVNPLFANERVWQWDLLCDLDACTVVVASRATAKKTGSLARTLATAASSSLATAMNAVVAAVDYGSSAVSAATTQGAPGASGGHDDHDSDGHITTRTTTSAAENTETAATATPPPSTTTTTASATSTAQTLQQLYQSLVQRMYRMRAQRVPLAERVHVLRLCLAEYMHVLLLLGVAVHRGLVEWQHASSNNNIAATASEDDDEGDTRHDGGSSNNNNVAAAAASVAHDTERIDGRLLTPLRGTFCTAAAEALRLQCQVTSVMDHIYDSVLHSPHEPVALPLCVAALRRCHDMPRDGGDTLLRLLHTLRAMMTTDERVLLLLRRMPCALGGLEPVAMQLTHPRAAVCAAAYALLERVAQLHEGHLAIGAMRSYLMLAYEDEAKARRAERERRSRALPLMQQAE